MCVHGDEGTYRSETLFLDKQWRNKIHQALITQTQARTQCLLADQFIAGCGLFYGMCLQSEKNVIGSAQAR